MNISTFPGNRKYNRRGGRPRLNIDFRAVRNAVQGHDRAMGNREVQ